jgi:hypothetical protein
MRVVAAEVLRRYALASSAEHTRSLPNRGPCLFTPIAPDGPTPADPPRSRLVLLRVRDRWEAVWRSVVQLVLGTYMVWDARRKHLCRSYFTALEQRPDPDGAAGPEGLADPEDSEDSEARQAER